jgi:hypothetical protein
MEILAIGLLSLASVMSLSLWLDRKQRRQLQQIADETHERSARNVKNAPSPFKERPSPLYTGKAPLDPPAFSSENLRASRKPNKGGHS